MTNHSSDLVWLAPEGTPLRAQLDRLHVLHGQLADRSRTPHTYTNILNQQYNHELQTHSTSNGSGEHKGGKNHFTPLLLRSQLHIICSVPGFYRHILARSDLAVTSLLDAVFAELSAGKMIPAFLCMRAIIEHVAHCSISLSNASLNIALDLDAKTTTDLLIAAKDSLQKSAYGTRVGWRNMTISPEAIRTRKEMKYTPEENRVDLTAKSVLSSIDKLGKRVTGVRNIYEVLCEFAHPNVGAQFAFNESASESAEVDDSGIMWKSFTAGPGRPVSFARVLAHVHTEIIECVVDCVQEMIVIGEAAKMTEQQLLNASQFVARKWISAYPKLYSPYETCPCRSRMKLRFCCGKKV